MNARSLTLTALPFYSALPFLAYCMHARDLFAHRLLPMNAVLYILLVELLVFVDHYYVLHRWKHMRHCVHHAFRTRPEMSAWVAFAFYPLDGLSQGLPILYAACIVPVPFYFVCSMIACVGVWTLCIHTSSFRLPFPLMGADYHFVHHKYNWFNFGLFTACCDSMWGTLKHPGESAEEALRHADGGICLGSNGRKRA